MNLKENLSFDRYQWTAKKILEIASEHFKDREISVYDIGSRDNILKSYITGNPINYKAFDLVPLDVSAEQWDIENIFPYTYPSPQVIAFLEIVEHLNNPWLCLKNVYNMIASGGFLILTTPNPLWSTSRIDLLVKGSLPCFTKHDLDVNHHVFTPWPHIIERLLVDSGFEIIEYVTLDGKTKIFDENLRGMTLPIKLIYRLIKKKIEYSDPTSIGMSYGIVARRV